MYLNTVRIHVFMQQPPDEVDGYIVSTDSENQTFNSSTNVAELSIDSLPPCNKNGKEYLPHNVTITANNSLGETERTSSASFCEYIVYIQFCILKGPVVTVGLS